MGAHRLWLTLNSLAPGNFNTFRPRQNVRHLANEIFRCILINQKVGISIIVSLKFVPKGPIKNIPALVQILAWRGPGDKPFLEPMVVSLLTHICVTRPQWVKSIFSDYMLRIKFMSTCGIALRWMPQTTFHINSALVQVIGWCCQAKNHFLWQC